MPSDADRLPGAAAPRRGVRTLAVAASALLLPLPCFSAANAQPAPPPPDEAPAADDDPNADILVTARKIPEPLDRTPVAISAFAGGDVEARSAVTIADLVNVVPNAVFDPTAALTGSSNSASVFIRGIGQSDFAFATDPGVAVYLDGVYIARATGSVLDLLDVGRVEVMRGPQGTSFGRNSIGGAVAIFTARPDPKYVSGRGKVEAGAFDRVGFEAVINQPVGAEAAVRLAASYRRDRGYARRLPAGEGLGGQRAFFVRGALRWEPADRLRLDLAADYTKRDDQSPASSLVSVVPPSVGAPSTLFTGLLYNNLIQGPDGIAPCQRPGFAFPFCGLPGLIQLPTLPASTVPFDARWTSGDFYTSFGDGPTGSDFRGGGVTATAAWEGPVSIRSITAWRRFDAHFGRDPDSSPIVMIDTENRLDHEQFSQELLLTRERKRLRAVAGLHYFEEHGSDRVTAPFVDETFRIINRLGLGCTLLPGATGLPGPLFLNPCPNLFRIDFAGDGTSIDNRSLSAFGEAVVKLNDWLSVSAGLRWTRDRKRIDISGFLAGGAPVSPNPVTSRTFSRVTPRIIVQVEPRRDLMAYASWSTGFKSGGFNQRYGAPIAAPTSFEPESVRTFEIGLRAPLRRGPIIRATAFLSDYRNIQAVVFDGGIPRTTNAAEGRSRGVELELVWRPTPALELGASYGWLDTRLTRLDPAIIGSFGTPIVNPLRLNNRFVNAPRHSLALSAQYEIEAGPLGTFTLRGDVSHRSSVANDAVNTPELIQGPVTLVNARLTWAEGDKGWSASLFATNLLDERYIIAGAADPAGFGAAEVNAAQPRRWGLSASYAW